MSVPFPDKLDPWRAARTGLCLEGVLAAREFTRIPAPGQVLAPVRARLKAGVDGNGLVRIDLWLEAEMSWQCQRCLNPLGWTQTAARTFEVRDSQDQHTDSQALGRAGTDVEYEVITAARGELLSLQDLIEDELLLALPFAPMHENCKPILGTTDAPRLKPDNPFAALAALQDRNNLK